VTVENSAGQQFPVDNILIDEIASLKTAGCDRPPTNSRFTIIAMDFAPGAGNRAVSEGGKLYFYLK